MKFHNLCLSLLENSGGYMEYSYEKILNKLLSEVPINESKNVYGITFVAGPGFGKSTVANILSKKLGLLIVANDQIRRVYDELGFDNTKYEEDIKKMAYDRTVFLLKNKTSHIVDANMQFYWQMAVDNYSKYDAKLYFVELRCNEEEILNRIKIREKDFGKNDNQSRATIEDYNRYLRLKEEKGFPDNLVFFTINTDTSIEEIEKQVDALVEKIKQ